MVDLLTGFGGEQDFGEQILQRNDDGSSSELDLPFAVNFFGTTYNTFFINNNGNVTFNGPISTFTPDPFPISNQPLIAAYWGDVDTRNEDSGLVYLATPDNDTVVVTYDNVGYFSSRADLRNSFQIILRDQSEVTGREGDFDIEFRYETLEWTTGDASGGTDGLGGTPAQAGFDAGNEQDFFTIPGSRTEQVLDLQNTSNVSRNANSSGLWRFTLRNGITPGSGPENPLLPIITDEGYEFNFNVDNIDNPIWIDPEIAIGYDYIVNSGSNISSLIIDTDAAGEDGVYDIFLPNSEGELVDSNFDIGVNETFSFTDNGFANGVSTFGIRGIDQDAGIDPDSSPAFVTGLGFTEVGTIDLTKIPLTIDVPVFLSIDDVTVDENDRTAELTVNLSVADDTDITFDYTTVDVTATAGSDYAANSGTLIIPAGETSGTIVVNINSDRVEESDEQFNVELSNFSSSNVIVENNQAVVTIANNNALPENIPNLSVDDVTVDEDAGTATVTVRLSLADAADITVDYTTTDGSAVADSDYTAKTGTLTIPAGETSGSIVVSINDDTTEELNEQFNIDFSNISSNAFLGENQGVVTTVDNDSPDNDSPDNDSPDNDSPIELLDQTLIRFRNTDIDSGTYLFVGEEEARTIRRDFIPPFAEEGPAFNVSFVENDRLVRFNRFSSHQEPGTYIFASEEESASIRENLSDVFTEEGLAFYALGADANLGADVIRFRNTNNSTYLFALEEEANDIRQNLSDIFVEEGVAFEVAS